MKSPVRIGLGIGAVAFSLMTAMCPFSTHAQQALPPIQPSAVPWPPAVADLANHPLTRQEKGGTNETGPYEVVPDFFKPMFPAGWTWGPVAGILAESPNRIYVYQRGLLPSQEQSADTFGLPLRNATEATSRPASNLARSLRREYILTVYDGNGNLIEDWNHLNSVHGPGSLAHRLRMDPNDSQKHLWLVDEGLSQVIKTTREGKVVMIFKCQGAQDIAFLPSGDFWCLEGLRGPGRVVKISGKDGRELMSFGKQGMGSGEFLGQHSVTVDRRGRIYVAEPGNRRIQVFDQDGAFIEMWPNIRHPAHISIDTNDRLWVADLNTNKIYAFDLNGRLASAGWGITGTYPGRIYGPSQFWVDSAGSLYVAEVFGGRVQKFKPRQGADSNERMSLLIQ